ncbi:MAG TPA: DNA polymerase III subunit beta, partial [Patescibacteria group bacterium]|nr:DNA polymerase III subunit beta [Patescibacteria group bacterium]
KVEEVGDISIPSKVITELIGNLPKGAINLASEKEQLKVGSEGFTSTILGMNSSDFPKILNSINENVSVGIPKKEFVKSLSQVVFATSLDDSRPILTGVLSIWSKDTLTLVATDGFRLSQKKINLKSSKKGDQKIVIPKNVLNELSRLGEEDENILFDFQEKEKQVVFGNNGVVLTSRLLEGDYPDFEKIIPKKSSISVRTDKEELLRAVKLASVFAKDAANIVKIKILKESVRVSAESGNSGSQEAKVDAKVEGEIGKEFEISFNYRFLEDFLHSVVGEEVKMEFSTTDKAGLFTDSTDSSYLHLIMPVKV